MCKSIPVYLICGYRNKKKKINMLTKYKENCITKCEENYVNTPNTFYSAEYLKQVEMFILCDSQGTALIN